MKITTRPFRVWMADRNLSRSDVEKELGISQSALSGFLSEGQVSLKVAERICAAYGLGIADVLGLVGEDNRLLPFKTFFTPSEERAFGLSQRTKMSANDVFHAVMYMAESSEESKNALDEGRSEKGFSSGYRCGWASCLRLMRVYWQELNPDYKEDFIDADDAMRRVEEARDSAETDYKALFWHIWRKTRRPDKYDGSYGEGWRAKGDRMTEMWKSIESAGTDVEGSEVFLGDKAFDECMARMPDGYDCVGEELSFKDVDEEAFFVASDIKREARYAFSKGWKAALDKLKRLWDEYPDFAGEEQGDGKF